MQYACYLILVQRDDYGQRKWNGRAVGEWPVPIWPIAIGIKFADAAKISRTLWTLSSVELLRKYNNTRMHSNLDENEGKR